MEKIKKIVLAYSGGLDTSVILHWLKEKYNCPVIAYAADLGQAEELDGLRVRAWETGASKVYIDDIRKTFLEEYAWRVLKSGAVYEHDYLLGTSFARPIIAKRMMEIAAKEKADAVAHGATGKGNDQVRFELTFMALDPSLKIIAPWKMSDWPIQSREDAVDYAKKYNIPCPVSKKRIYSEDRNLWHISHEGGELEDPARAPASRVFTISSTLEKAPNRAEYVSVDFVEGVPVGLNSRRMGAVRLLEKLNEIGGKHAIGQKDIVENRLVGMKSRGVYETPGGTILYEAHKILESLVLDKQTLQYKVLLAQKYAELVYNGEWFTPLKDALDAFVDQTQKVVTGRVRLKLYKGNCVPAGVTSPHSLYVEDLAGFGKDAIYDQKDAIGFIRLYGLPLKVRALLNKKT